MITFQTEDIEMPAINEEQVREWIKAVAASYGKRVGPISYFFCSDQRILEVNLEYLQHDYYTDIITFDYCEGHRLSGDIFISLDTVRSNAEILHLCGINDKGHGEREIMEAAENKALGILFL